MTTLKITASHGEMTEFSVDRFELHKDSHREDNVSKVSGVADVSDVPTMRLVRELMLAEEVFVLTSPRGELMLVKVCSINFVHDQGRRSMTFHFEGEILNENGNGG
jgi:hypothetical protein